MAMTTTTDWPSHLFRDIPLGDLPALWAQQYGERECLVDGPDRFTFVEFAELVDRAATRLMQDGHHPGQHAVVQLPNSWTFLVTFHALCRAGLIPILMLPTHGPSEVEDVARRARATAIFTPHQWQGQPTAERARSIARKTGASVYVSAAPTGSLEQAYLSTSPSAKFPQVNANTVGLVLLSGGSTGRSKLIGRTHNDYEYNVRTCSSFCAIDEHTVYLAALPVAHNFALGNPGVVGTLSRGGRVVLIPSPSASKALPAIRSEGVTHSSVVPSVGMAWAASAAQLGPGSTLRVLHVGGSTLSRHTAQDLEDRLGCEIQQVFGMAEGLICYVPPGLDRERAWTTQGRPTCEYHELRVIDAEGLDVAAGSVGQLAVRGPHTITSYYLDDGENDAAFSDGWYLTGDLVRRRPDDLIEVHGRLKDVINRGGEKISAAEVEAVLQHSSRVAQVAVVPIPDPLLGERVCAVIEPTKPDGEDLTLREVRELCARAGLSRFKTPEHLALLTHLPLTRVGKPDKPAIRALLTAHAQHERAA